MACKIRWWGRAAVWAAFYASPFFLLFGVTPCVDFNRWPMRKALIFLPEEP